jgi:5-dehydro-2-deoxygluconokinase
MGSNSSGLTYQAQEGVPKSGGLEVVTIGRCSVDLYGVEIGSRLEDVATFRKSVGGCPANIAIGCARLGLKSAILTRVGDEQMGRFIISEMKREGVSTDGIVLDDSRLTALVVLAVRNRVSFPHIFYRENCADMALCEDDVDPALIARTASIVVTGTHFSTEQVAAASWKAIKIARNAGVKVVLDIDFRPSLWGLTGHKSGEARYILSSRVHGALKDVLAVSNVVVGTEEELRVAMNQDDLQLALQSVRKISSATIVCKRGSKGCEIFPTRNDGVLGESVRGGGFKARVLNAIGAGDAFMSGFLRGWLAGESWETTATWANACGAIVVSRLLCSSEYPTWSELSYFLKREHAARPPFAESDLLHLHWTETRQRLPDELFVLAVDHRVQFEEIADGVGADRARLSEFNSLAVRAAALVAGQRSNIGIICDGEYGVDALFEAEELPLWIARTVEQHASKPVTYVLGHDVGSGLLSWPKSQTVKCSCHYHPDDPPSLRARQEDALLQLDQACKALGRELLIEIIPDRDRTLDDETVSRAISALYNRGIRPDWWKLEPIGSSKAWENIGKAVASGDAQCRGILILGSTSHAHELRQAFEASQGCSLVRGFVVGRLIVGEIIREWLQGRLDDKGACEAIASKFEAVIGLWQASRSASSNTIAETSVPAKALIQGEGTIDHGK